MVHSMSFHSNTCRSFIRNNKNNSIYSFCSNSTQENKRKRYKSYTNTHMHDAK